MDGSHADNLGRRLTTRRAVAKTGAKLAYTTPLIAAAFKVSALNARAQIFISPLPPESGTCRYGQDTCKQGPAGNTCNGRDDCFCYNGANGVPVCVSSNGVCGGGGCDDPLDCFSILGPGAICVVHASPHCASCPLLQHACHWPCPASV